MSKGSNRRPTEVPRETFESNWDRIFKKPQRKVAYCKCGIPHVVSDKPVCCTRCGSFATSSINR